MEHAQICHFVQLGSPRMFPGLGPGSQLLLTSPLSSDVSCGTIFPALLSGALLVLASKWEIVDFLEDIILSKNVSHLYITRSLFNLIAMSDLPSLQVINITGETPQQSHIDMWRGKVPYLINAYGSTEVNVVTTQQYTKADTLFTGATIGRPFPNTTCFVLDELLYPVPVGAVGELYVGGAQVAREYLNRPDLTNKAFIPNPFIPGDRLYKTGDLVKYKPDGLLVFQGRTDTCIKIRGQRVELQEVEIALMDVGNGSINTSMVVVIDDYLVGVVTPKDVDVSTLRDRLHDMLPPYMVPSLVIAVKSIPTTTSGKADSISLKALLEEMLVSKRDSVCQRRTSSIGRKPLLSSATTNNTRASVKERPSFVQRGSVIESMISVQAEECLEACMHKGYEELLSFLTLSCNISEKQDVVVQILTEIAHAIVGKLIRPHQSLMNAGIDSVTLPIFASQVQKLIMEPSGLEEEVNVARLFEFTTLHELSQWIVSCFGSSSKPDNSVLSSHCNADPMSVPEQQLHAKRYKCDEIAIVGMACRFPGGANSPDLFWSEVLSKGKDCIVPVLPGRLGSSSGKVWHGGLIDDVELPTFPPGYHLFSASDVPGENALPIVENDWPAFADREVRYIGQVIYLLVGPDPDIVEDLLKQINITYVSATPAFTVSQSKLAIDGAIHGEDNQFDYHELTKGDIDKGFAEAVSIIEDSCSTSYQEHLYLETQGLIGYPEEGKIVIEGSMQCPWYVHHCMSHVLGHQNVRVIQCTTGGGFGGKEDFPDVLAGPLAVAVERLKQPIRLIFNREEDIAFTSKRHPVEFNYRTGVDKDGKIVAMDLQLDINSGGYFSLSGIVLQRSLTTCTNVYDIPNVRVSGTAWATNTVPNGAFRGFGAPQTCFAIETHLSHVAKQIGQDPVAFKQAHFLKSNSKTLTGAEIYGELVLDEMVTRADELSGYYEKAARYAKQGEIAADKFGKRRGIGLSVFQHGCGFAGDLEEALVKAKVAIVKDVDGHIEILASNTDIGQGLSLTFCKIVAKTLDIALDHVHLATPDTDKVPDSGPTVASRSILIVGYLLENAAKELKESWIDGKTQRVEQVYKKPDYHHWDQQTYQGNAYQATSYGINVVELELGLLTGQSEILGVCAVYDIGHAIDSQVFRGQIDGGLVQAIGYGSSEKLELTAEGAFAQKSMADYVIPTSLDVPTIVSDLVDNPYDFGPQGAKGGGELTHNGGAAAYVAAVESAIGVKISSIPVSPELVSELLYASENGGENGD